GPGSRGPQANVSDAARTSCLIQLSIFAPYCRPGSSTMDAIAWIAARRAQTTGGQGRPPDPRPSVAAATRGNSSSRAAGPGHRTRFEADESLINLRPTGEFMKSEASDTTDSPPLEEAPPSGAPAPARAGEIPATTAPAGGQAETDPTAQVQAPTETPADAQ